ncbi:MAG: hypothetical protein Q8L52_00245 [bacterium]|nr:hypothetical protein [bacterium]
MKHAISALVALILLVPALASAQDVKKGEKQIVPAWTWVEVRNLEPIESGNTGFAFGESCGIQGGGSVSAVGMDGNRILVRYSITGVQYGSACPAGVLFFMAKDSFAKMTVEYRQVQVLVQSERDLVAKLMKK